MYKKYIYRDGKRFGPYYCESYRDKDGKVKTRFVSGPHKADKLFIRIASKKTLMIFEIGLFVFLLLILGNINYNLKISGKIVQDQNLESVTSFDKNIAESMAEGEIIGNIDLEKNVKTQIKQPILDNKILEFNTPEGKIELEFDLLNYSDWYVKETENVLEAENFDININESKDRYKWGYNVRLRDLNFMAKINVRADNIIIIDNQTLKIGNYYLSFADLVNQNYIVNVEPVILENINLTEDIAENITEINITSNLTNIDEVNVTIPENETETVNLQNETQDETPETNISEEIPLEPLEQIPETPVENVEQPVEQETEELPAEQEEGEQPVEEPVEQPIEQEQPSEQPTEIIEEEIAEQNPVIISGLLKPIAKFFVNSFKGLALFITNGIRGIIGLITGFVIGEEQTISIYVQKDFTNEAEIGDIINLDPYIIGIMGENGSAVDNLGNVYQCGTINQSGSYVMNQSIIKTSTGTCIQILAANIILDCNGYNLTTSLTEYVSYAGVSSNYYNTTIKNCYIDMGSIAEGIALYSSANNSYIFNNTLTGQSSGLYLSGGNDGPLNSIIENNTFSLNTKGVLIYTPVNANHTLRNNLILSNSRGIEFRLGSNQILMNNNLTYNNIPFQFTSNEFDNQIDTTNIVDGSYNVYYNYSISDYVFDLTTASNAGIIICAGCNNITVKDLDISNNHGYYGILLFNTTNSTIENSTFNLNPYGIYLLGNSNNNNLTKNTLSSNTYGIYISDSSNNNFSDTNVSGSSTYDVDVISSSTNNIFLNVSYNLAKENVDSDSSLTRKWYYQTYVNDSGGNDVSNANVKIYGFENEYQLNTATNGTGWINITGIIDYVNTGGTKSYYSNYTIYAYNSTHVGNVSRNFTLEPNKLNDIITISEGIFVEPTLLISSCKSLSVENGYYTVQNNITSSGTCLTVSANNVTIDMNGHKIERISGDGITSHCNGYEFDPTNLVWTTGGFGVYIDNYNNTIIKNGKIKDFGIGVYGNNASNVNISNMQINSYLPGYFCRNYGAYFWSGINNNIENSVFNISSVGEGPTVYGVYLKSTSGNVLNNITINEENYNVNAYGIYFDSASGNTIKNIENAGRFGDYGGGAYYIYSTSSSNNLIRDSNLSSVSSRLNYFVSSINTTFLNTTAPYLYYVDSASSVYRKWYYRAHTTDWSGTDVENAIIEIYNGKEISPYISLNTNSSGWTNVTHIIEYSKIGGTTTIYDNSVIAANWNLTLWDSHSYNVTEKQNNLNDSLILDIDITPPILSGTNISMTSDSQANNVFALISWIVNADDPSNYSNISYGLTLTLGEGSNETYIKNAVPSLTIGPLMNQTVYYFNYTSCDFAGNCNTSSASFTTISPASVGVTSTGGGISCIPSWECDVCSGAAVGQTGTQTCNDLRKCTSITTKTQSCTVQESYFKPKEPTEPEPELPKPSGGEGGDKDCTSNWQCSEWSECRVVYNLEDIIKGRTLLKGEQERLCKDTKNCNYDKTERQECSTKQAIYAQKVEKCFDNFLEVFNEDNVLISRLKLIEGQYEQLNVQMLFDEAGYCPYCFDGQKNYDEDEIDCIYESGRNCPVCSQEAPFLRQNYSLMLIILLALTLLCFLFIIWYLFLLRKTKKRISRITKMSKFSLRKSRHK